MGGAFSKTCVENEGVGLAPQVGLEPTTLRLTAELFKEMLFLGFRRRG
jgi:hypothetical protein